MPSWGAATPASTAGQRQLVLISGEPGIGKTALIDRFIESLDLQRAKSTAPHVVVRGQCIEAYGAGDPHRPLREAVEQLFRRGGEPH